MDLPNFDISQIDPELIMHFMQRQQQKLEMLQDELKNFIDPSFMLEMYQKILGTPGIFELRFNQYPIRDPFAVRLDAIFDDFDVDICRQLAMVHHYKTSFLPKYRKTAKALKQDEHYKEELTEDVLTQLRLRHLQTFSSSSLLSHRPPHFAVDVVAIGLLHFMSSKKEHSNFYYGALQNILEQVRSIILLVNNQLLHTAMATLRTLLESCLTYKALYNNPNAIQKYIQFKKWRKDYDNTGEWPDEFEEQYKNKACPKSNYLNYGWIDGLPNSKTSKSRKYIFMDLIETLEFPQDKEFAINLYKECCEYSHGALSLFIDDFEYFLNYIAVHTGYLLLNILYYWKQKFDQKDIVFNGVNVEEWLRKKTDECNDILNKYIERKH